MARRDFLPSSDEALRAWAANFGRLINASAAAYGLSDEQADAYSVLAGDYAAKLATATDPETRGVRTVFQKSEAKRELVRQTRQIARQINNLMNVTDDQRQALGLTIRDTPTPVPAPGVAPVVFAELVGGRSVKITLRQNSNLRARPEGVADALIFTHLGPTAPAEMNGWAYAGTVSRTATTITLPPSPAADKVWVCAFWTNAKGQSGPASTPVSVDLPAGGVLPREAEAGEPLRLAA